MQVGVDALEGDEPANEGKKCERGVVLEDGVCGWGRLVEDSETREG